MALSIQSTALKTVSDFMYGRGFSQLLPVVISTLTDPLNHRTGDARVTYNGCTLSLTKSMIFHKQVALASRYRKAIYIVSPNVRFEPSDRARTGRHLLEFCQVDYEMKDARAHDVMRLSEELFIEILSRVKESHEEELERLQRKLRVPRAPFAAMDSKTLVARHGKEWEREESRKASEPFWVTNHDREFYDREDPKSSHDFLNFDLVYPEGFGEALSGGEREWEYGRILERMKSKNVDPEAYEKYLTIARKGVLPRTAGAGFGVERLVRFICGSQDVAEVAPFGKKPGQRNYYF